MRSGYSFGTVILSLALTSPIPASSASAGATAASAAAVPEPADPNGMATPSVPARPTHHARARPSLDDRVKVLARNLELDEAQQQAVKQILVQRQQETLRLRTDPSLSGEARIARFRALQDTTVERIRAVLNDQQKAKYNPLAVRGLKPEPDQRTVEDWLKLTTPQ